MQAEEKIEVVNDRGEVLCIALRSEVHGNPSLLHRVVHVLVINNKGELLLQKRSANKDVAPGKWDTSVGGHIAVGEAPLASANREMEEELGLALREPEYLYSYIHTNTYESELVTTYSCIYDGDVDIPFNRDEIDEVRFWSFSEIKETVGGKILSANFEDEFRNYLKHITRPGGQAHRDTCAIEG